MRVSAEGGEQVPRLQAEWTSGVRRVQKDSGAEGSGVAGRAGESHVSETEWTKQGHCLSCPMFKASNGAKHTGCAQ